MSTGTFLTVFDPKALAVLDDVAGQCDIALREAGNSISGALTVAENMQKLRQLVTPQMLNSLAALQGTALGFRTDRKNAKSGSKEYTPEELRDPFIEATVRGFRAIGNEFNIISGNFYGAKAGFERKVRTFPGLSDFQAAYDVEEQAGGFARVQCVASWLLNGEHDSFSRRKEIIKGKPFDNRIRVRVNEGMGYDALLGKAQRKFLAAVYDYLINADTATPEGDPDDTIVDPDAGKKVRRSKIFDDAPTQQDSSPNDGDQSVLIDGYRNRLSAITSRSDVSNIAREASKDTSLSIDGRKAVMALCTEATRLWPTKLQGTAKNTSGDHNSSKTAAQKQREPGDDDEPLPTQTQQAAKQARADDDILLGEYQDQLAQADTDDALNALEKHAMDNSALRNVTRRKIVEAILAKRSAVRSAAGGAKKDRLFDTGGASATESGL